MQLAKAFRSAVWVASQPQYFSEFARKAIFRLQLRSELKEATEAMQQLHAIAVTEQVALERLFPGATIAPQFEVRFNAEIDESRDRVQSSRDKLGGAASLNLLYQCARHIKPAGAIETGVAYGWSSFAILAALNTNHSDI